MNKTIKVIVGVLVLSTIEYISIVLLKDIDMGSLFALWGIFFLLFLINSIFGLFGNSYSKGHIVGGTVKGAPIGYVDTAGLESPKPKITSGLFKTINYVYIILIIANIIGYAFSINL
jgi:hypothetical protein